MKKFEELCKQFKMINYNELRNNTGICLKSHKQIYKTKEKTTCDFCKREFIITEDCMCPNCDSDCLFYNGPDINLANLNVDQYVGANNYGSWDAADYFSVRCDDYYCIIVFCVYYDPNAGYDRKTNTYWKPPADWYETILIVYDSAQERDDLFTNLTTMKNTFDLLNKNQCLCIF